MIRPLNQKRALTSHQTVTITSTPSTTTGVELKLLAVMGVAVGSINSTEMKSTHITAIQPIGALQAPSCHGPFLKSDANWRRRIGIAYAIYRPMTAIEVTAT